VDWNPDQKTLPTSDMSRKAEGLSVLGCYPWTPTTHGKMKV